MKRDDMVTVFLAEHPELRRLHVRVVMASANLNSLALSLGEFNLSTDSMTIHPEYGYVLCLLRDEDSQPFWRCLFSGTRYGIVAEGRS